MDDRRYSSRYSSRDRYASSRGPEEREMSSARRAAREAAAARRAEREEAELRAAASARRAERGETAPRETAGARRGERAAGARNQAYDRRATYEPTYREDSQDAVRYRQVRRAAKRQKRFWGAYLAVAAAVVVVTVLGIASAFAGPPVPRGESSAPVYTPGAQQVQESSPDATKNESRSSEPGAQDLENRAKDFAVDPARKDWNFKTNGKKTVYLTIDDGPSEKTQEVLDILDRYNCKATFFVVGHNDDYFPMIAEAFRRGHTIGLHTMTHDYATVYSSPAAYFEDLTEIGEVVKNQIGFVPCFIRFPGGSSNGISASYCEGIMSELTEEVQEKGYQYYDWNLSVGDGSVHTADEIAEYGMADEGNENIMLLCHDSATKQTTVEALPRIIEHYQSLGYTFEAIDRNSWVCHHGVSN